MVEELALIPVENPEIEDDDWEIEDMVEAVPGGLLGLALAGGLGWLIWFKQTKERWPWEKPISRVVVSKNGQRPNPKRGISRSQMVYPQDWPGTQVIIT